MRLPALLSLLGAAVIGACAGDRPVTADPAATVPLQELSLAADSAALLDSADALISRHQYVGLVTVDSTGRPRIRTVGAFRLAKPETARDRFTIFVLTRMSTRKIEHLAKNPAATLYFDEDGRTSYATIMGRAIIHRDPTLPRLQEFLDSATVRFFWPDYPRDFVMLEIAPQWLEFIGPGLWNDPNTWRPQAVVFR